MWHPFATVLLGKSFPNIVLKKRKNTLTDSILEIKIDINFISPHSLVVIQNFWLMMSLTILFDNFSVCEDVWHKLEFKIYLASIERCFTLLCVQHFDIFCVPSSFHSLNCLILKLFFFQNWIHGWQNKIISFISRPNKVSFELLCMPFYKADAKSTPTYSSDLHILGIIMLMLDL